MRIIDRYILRSLISAFLGSLFLFLFLYIIIDLFERLDEILKNRIPLSVLRDYYLTFLPTIFHHTAPLASLLSCSYTLGRLNRDNEILALRTSGLSILKISKSVIFFGLTLSICVFFINERYAYLAQKEIRDIEAEYFSKEKSQNFKNLAFLGENNRLYFIQNFYPEKNKIEGITILEHDENFNLSAKIIAEKGVFQKDFWILYESLRYRTTPDGSILGRPVYFDEKVSDIREKPQDLIRERISPEFMNIKDLSRYINKLARAEAETVVRNFKVDLHNKIASPFTSLIILFPAIPLAFSMRKKRVGFFSLGICIILGFFYYVIGSICLNLGKIGVFPPFLSAWLSHLLFLSMGIYLSFKIT